MTTIEVTPFSLTVQVGANLDMFGWNIMVTDIKGWHGGGSAVRRDGQERSGAHGQFKERGWRDARLLTVECQAWAGSRAEAAQLADDLASFLADGDIGRLTVVDPDQGTRWTDCYLFGTPDVVWDVFDQVGFVFELVCPDPRKYGLPVSAVTGVPKEGGGLVYDLYVSDTSPGVLDYGNPGDSGTVSFFNNGTADSAAVLRVDGYAPGFTITELGTGNRLVYTGTVPTGSHVILDPRDGSVLLDGTADRSTALAVREWTRTPAKGTSVFLFESAGPNAKLTVEGVPAWW